MRNNLYQLLYVINLLCVMAVLSSCANDCTPLPIQNEKENHKDDFSSVSNNDILSAYIRQKAKSTLSRSHEKLMLNPIVLDNDTLMYYVNYDEGWELFSNDRRMPMSLMMCDSGYFDLQYISNTPGISNYFNKLLEDLKTVKNIDIKTNDVNETWMTSHTFGLDDEKIPFSEHWIMAGYNDITYQKIEKPHLIDTHWHAGIPYNEYAMTDSIFPHNKMHSEVDVATAQYINYIHKNLNIPNEIPSLATKKINMKDLFSVSSHQQPGIQ